MEKLLESVRQCQICKNELPLEPRPIIQASNNSKLLIIGQAPGLKAHDTYKPWNDPSGVRLRKWLGIDDAHFYNPDLVAIVPIGLCYPGRAASGDKPPSKVCAPTWHSKVLNELENVQLTLLIGDHAQRYYLKDKPSTLTETVANWRLWAPTYLPIPHPSPRNAIWLKRNPWFEQDTLPYIQLHVQKVLS